MATNEPSADNIISVWQDDLLGRQEDADYLERFLIGAVADRNRRGVQGSYVLNVDGHWGAGKSFFVNRLARQFRAKGFVVAEVNAWRDDHVDDPFIAVLAAIDRAVQPHVQKGGSVRKLWDKVTSGAAPVATRMGAGFLKTFIKKQVGESLEDILGSVPATGIEAFDKALEETDGQVIVEIERIADQATEKIIKQFAGKSEAIDGFRHRLGTAAKALNQETGAPIFVIVDELDRCRPSYAIALLERVKHLFEVDGVAFIFATNAGQLQYSVQGAYGPGFNGYKYLRRFFERTYLLDHPEPSAFLASRMVNIDTARIRAPKNEPKWFMNELVKAYSLDLREIEQLMDIIGSTVAVWNLKLPVDLLVLAPVALSLIRRGTTKLDEVAEEIPKTFRPTIGFRGGDYRSDPQEVTFNVRQAFNIFVSNSLLKDAMRIQGDDAELLYVRDMMMPEWNGKSTNPGQYSIQYQIPGLVANAGKFIQAMV